MSFRNVVLALTSVAILVIGYMLDHPAVAPTTQRVALGPTTEAAKAQKRKTASRSKKKPPAEGPDEPLKDPFSAPQSTPARRRASRLEELELSDLRLVAIVRDIEGRLAASVEDAAGIGFLLREGSLIGSRGTCVRSISPAEVVVGEPGGANTSLKLGRAPELFRTQ